MLRTIETILLALALQLLYQVKGHSIDIVNIMNMRGNTVCNNKLVCYLYADANYTIDSYLNITDSISDLLFSVKITKDGMDIPLTEGFAVKACYEYQQRTVTLSSSCEANGIPNAIYHTPLQVFVPWYSTKQQLALLTLQSNKNFLATVDVIQFKPQVKGHSITKVNIKDMQGTNVCNEDSICYVKAGASYTIDFLLYIADSISDLLFSVKINDDGNDIPLTEGFAVKACYEANQKTVTLSTSCQANQIPDEIYHTSLQVFVPQYSTKEQPAVLTIQSNKDFLATVNIIQLKPQVWDSSITDLMIKDRNGNNMCNEDLVCFIKANTNVTFHFKLVIDEPTNSLSLKATMREGGNVVNLTQGYTVHACYSSNIVTLSSTCQPNEIPVGTYNTTFTVFVPKYNIDTATAILTIELNKGFSASLTIKQS